MLCGTRRVVRSDAETDKSEPVFDFSGDVRNCRTLSGLKDDFPFGSRYGEKANWTITLCRRQTRHLQKGWCDTISEPEPAIRYADLTGNGNEIPEAKQGYYLPVSPAPNNPDESPVVLSPAGFCAGRTNRIGAGCHSFSPKLCDVTYQLRKRHSDRADRRTERPSFDGKALVQDEKRADYAVRSVRRCLISCVFTRQFFAAMCRR